MLRLKRDFAGFKEARILGGNTLSKTPSPAAVELLFTDEL